MTEADKIAELFLNNYEIKDFEKEVDILGLIENKVQILNNTVFSKDKMSDNRLLFYLN